MLRFLDQGGVGGGGTPVGGCVDDVATGVLQAQVWRFLKVRARVLGDVLLPCRRRLVCAYNMYGVLKSIAYNWV